MHAYDTTAVYIYAFIEYTEVRRQVCVVFLGGWSKYVGLCLTKTTVHVLALLQYSTALSYRLRPCVLCACCLISVVNRVILDRQTAVALSTY